jgi:hypothetical protein
MKTYWIAKSYCDDILLSPLTNTPQLAESERDAWGFVSIYKEQLLFPTLEDIEKLKKAGWKVEKVRLISEEEWDKIEQDKEDAWNSGYSEGLPDDVF